MRNNKIINKRVIFCMLFLILIAVLTFNSIFKDMSLSYIIENIMFVSPFFSIICILLVSLYFILQGLYTKIMYKSMNVDVTLKKGIFYSMVEFFFSGITPSSTGGQPVQLAYMNKDKIPMGKSIILLILYTVFFKVFMIFFAVIILLFYSDLVFSNGVIFTVLFFVGLLGDLLVIFVGYLLSFKPLLVKRIVGLYAKIINKFFPNKKINKIDDTISNYKKEVEYVKTHKKDVVYGIIIAFLQRICFFSITYIVFKAFNLTGYGYFELLIIQITVQMCIEFVPLPGGAGVSEHLLHQTFLSVFGLKLAGIGMTLTRIYTFYLPLIVIGITIILYNLIHLKKNNK